MKGEPIDYSNPDDVLHLFDDEEKTQASMPPPLPHKPGFGRFGWRVIIGLGSLGALVLAFFLWSVFAAINKQEPIAGRSVVEKTDEPTTVASTDKASVQNAVDKAKGIQKSNADQAAADEAQKTGTVVAESDSDDVDTSGMTPEQKARLAGRRPGSTKTGGNATAEQRRDEARKHREEVLNSTPIAVDNSSWFDEQGNLKKPVATASAQRPSIGTTTGDGPSGGNSGLDPEQTAEIGKLRKEQAKQMAQFSPPSTERASEQEPGQPGQGDNANRVRTSQQPAATISTYVDSLVGSDGRQLYRVRSPYFLHCTVKNRINGALAGPLVCELSDAVWSDDHQHLLAPVGSVMAGDVSAVGDVNQQRLFAAFHRMILPNGELIDLDTFKGLSIAGESGLAGKVNRHLVSMFAGASVMAAIGAVASIGNSINSFNYSFSSAYRQQLTSQLGQAGTQMITRFTNRLPTIILRQNENANVYVASDLLFPEYDPKHHVDSDMLILNQKREVVMSLQRDIAGGILQASVARSGAAAFLISMLLASPLVLFAICLALSPSYRQQQYNQEKKSDHHDTRRLLGRNAGSRAGFLLRPARAGGSGQ